MKKTAKIPIITFIIIAVLISGFFYASYKIKTPLSKQIEIAPVEKTFMVAAGDGIFDIGPKLQAENLISHKIWFYSYVLFKGWGAKLQAGEYNLSASTSISEIARKIAKGQIIGKETDIQITIPEGFSIKQIDDRLAANSLIEAGQLINFAKQAQFNNLDTSSFDFPLTYLEGYLFPDTYKFAKDSTVEEIVQKMLDNFNKKLDQDLRQAIAKQGKTVEEIIILSSIIQLEGHDNEEMPTIASVFYNRLEIDYLLQSDATVNYVTGNQRRQPTIADTKVNSLYNTYLYTGLPPAPISSPGLKAIEAAIFSVQTDYFYFLHPLDKSAVFSKTLEEHNQNKAKYLP